jgi:hypothetical protein
MIGSKGLKIELGDEGRKRGIEGGGKSVLGGLHAGDHSFQVHSFTLHI